MAYERLRNACDTEGPLDRKTVELIKVGISTTLEHEGGLIAHVSQARKTGAIEKEIEHAILVATGQRGGPGAAAAPLHARSRPLRPEPLPAPAGPCDSPPLPRTASGPLTITGNARTSLLAREPAAGACSIRTRRKAHRAASRAPLCPRHGLRPSDRRAPGRPMNEAYFFRVRR